MPLSGFRVVELGSDPALDYCGKLFADFGADVLKVEPADGDPRRRIPPLLDAGAGRMESGTFAWLNTNKRSVFADPQAIYCLLAEADVLLDARPRSDRSSGRLSHAALRAAHPGLVLVAISWFGESGPYRDFAASDASVRALAGLTSLVGPVRGPPILSAPDGQAGYIGGLSAFVAAASGVLGRGAGGRRFEASTHEALVTVAEYETAVGLSGLGRKRNGINRFGRNYPVSIYPTKQGLLGVTVVTPAQWRGFCAMIGRPGLAEDERYSVNVDRIVCADELDSVIAPILAQRTAEEWFALGLRHKLPLCIVPRMTELLEQPIHRERGVFAPIRIGEAVFEAQVLPQHLTRTPPKRGGTAPSAGADRPEWKPGTRPLPSPEHAAPAGSLPLSGLRILDLTMGWAGPSATRLLGDLGADIVKVEACQYPDWWRGTDKRPAFFEQQLYEKSYWFQAMNRNKRGITLDLTTADGKALLLRLVATADAVIENYSVEVLPKLGLDYPALRAAREDIIMASMPAFGTGNAWSSCRAYGSTLEQASGLPTLTGWADNPPTMNHTAYGDPVGGFNAAAALLIALIHRKRTGEGQLIDISQVECMMPMVAPALISQAALGAAPPRLGNRHPTYTPQGAFRCAGDDDDWVVLTVDSDLAWRGLCDLLGREEWAEFDATSRHGRAAEIETAVADWTARLAADEAMMVLQARGIAAGVARAPLDLTRDPHLLVRGFWREADNPFMGRHLHASAPFREGPAAYALIRPSPTLGEHNAEVLGGLLGLNARDLRRLADIGVIGTEAVPKGSPAMRKG